VCWLRVVINDGYPRSYILHARQLVFSKRFICKYNFVLRTNVGLPRWQTIREVLLIRCLLLRLS